MTEKIYVFLPEGSDAWVAINAKQVTDDQYELLPDNAYDDLDPSILFEFFPGDIVRVTQQSISMGTVGQVAKQLIHRAPWQDRDYWEFQFYAIKNELSINKDTAAKYKQIIERIKMEQTAGQYFYPGVLDAIDKLSKLLTNPPK